VSNEISILGDRPFAGTVINVQHYGATGDDSTDDTRCVRAAIAASEDGDAIYFPHGTYLVSGPLAPKAKQVYFSLANATIKAIKARPGSKPFPVFDVESELVEFHHLTLDLTESARPTTRKDARPGILAQAPAAGAIELVVASCRIRGGYGQGVKVGGSEGYGHDRVIVRDSFVEDCYESALTLNHVNGARVEACRFEHCRNGIQAASCRDVVIYAVNVTNNRRHGIAFRFSHDWHVNNCVAKGNGGKETDKQKLKLRGWGIAAGGGPEDETPNSDFTITNNISDGNYAGEITLDPTEADDPETPEVESAEIFEQRARISGNICRGRKGGTPLGDDHPHGSHGIHVRNSSDVVVTDNLCHHNHNCGIAIVNSSHVLVQANACYQNANGIGLFNQDLEGSGGHLIGVNMLYDNEEADLEGMP
jgi:parallel beta-helix repeat protein